MYEFGRDVVQVGGCRVALEIIRFLITIIRHSVRYSHVMSNKVGLADFQAIIYTFDPSTAMSAEASTSKASKKTKQSREREEDESAGEGEASVEVNKNKRHRKEKRESA